MMRSAVCSRNVGQAGDLDVRVDPQLLPMEERPALRRRDRRDACSACRPASRSARAVSWRQRAAAIFWRAARRVARPAAALRKRLGQLIDRIQMIGQCDARLARQQMAGKLRGDAVEQRRGQRCRQPVTRPREQGQREQQQNIVRPAVDLHQRWFRRSFRPGRPDRRRRAGWFVANSSRAASIASSLRRTSRSFSSSINRRCHS
jgi:hypothetical protein